MNRARSAAFLLAILLVVSSGCGTLAGGDTSKAEVEAGRKAGLHPYWLGESFPVIGATAYATATEFNGPDRPHVVFRYRLGKGASGIADVRTYSKVVGGWRNYLELGDRIRGMSIESTTIGTWSGDVRLIPSGLRPVNTVTYVLDINEMVVIATTKAVSTGVPGTDLNPLIDAELWGQVLEGHLRPYPE